MGRWQLRTITTVGREQCRSGVGDRDTSSPNMVAIVIKFCIQGLTTRTACKQLQNTHTHTQILYHIKWLKNVTRI